MNLQYLLTIISILLAAMVFFLIFKSGGDDGSTIAIQENYFGLAMPFLAILFAALANRFISKDNKIVKSMDRLR